MIMLVSIIQFIDSHGPAVAAIGAIIAAIVALSALRTAKQVARTQLFLELRRSHGEIQAKMDRNYHIDGWEPTPEERKTLEPYWLQTCTEWFAITQLNKSWFFWRIGRLGEWLPGPWLWKGFYRKAIDGALKHKPLRDTLYYMLSGEKGDEPGSTFSGQAEAFEKEIWNLMSSDQRSEMNKA